MRSGTLNNVASSQYPLPGSGSVREQLRAAAMTRFGNEAWPAGGFVARLPVADRTALLDIGTPVKFEDDQILLVQGEAGDHLYVLTSGLVKIIVGAVSGAQTTIAIRSRGDLVGEFALLDDQPRTATARAAGPVTALRVGGAAFLGLIGHSPAIRVAETRYLLGKMRESTERRAAERVWEARERIAQVLYDLGERYGQPDSDGMIRIPLTQSDLGDLAGMAVSTAERVLKELRRQGAVSTRYREITIRDKAYLGSIRFAGENAENPLSAGIFVSFGH
jgi:CRP/FNR family cyclic AMP-dependent transcriptional regulator